MKDDSRLLSLSSRFDPTSTTRCKSLKSSDSSKIVLSCSLLPSVHLKAKISKAQGRDTMGYNGRTFSIEVPNIRTSNTYSPSITGIPSPTEPAKRTRTLTTAFQQEKLNALLAQVSWISISYFYRRMILIAPIFVENFQTAFPTTQQRNALAEEIDMSPRRVQVSC